MDTRGKAAGKSKSDSNQTILNPELGVVKRTSTKPKRLSPRKASKESYLEQEEFLQILLGRDLDIRPGTLLRVTIELGMLTFPEEKGYSNNGLVPNKTLCQINKNDILVFLGIRYDSRAATYNARVLLPNTQIVWIPFSCFKQFYLDDMTEISFEDFSSFFACLLVKHTLFDSGE